MSRAHGRVPRAVAAAAGALAALVCLAGCGIPTTGVVEAGEPGGGIHPRTLLYFVRAYDGALTAVERRDDVPMGAEGALGLLFKGPQPMEQKMLGLTTLLPRPSASIALHRSGGTLTVDFGPDAGRLPGTAVDQIVCTAVAAEALRYPDAAPPDVAVTAAGRPQHGTREGVAPCPTTSSATPVPHFDGAQPY